MRERSVTDASGPGELAVPSVHHAGALPALLAAALLAAAPAAAQEGITVTASAMEIDFSGRMQLQAATSPCSDFPFGANSPCATQSPALDLFTRRVRLSAVVKINDFLTAKVEPDYADVSGVVLRDAYGRLTLSDHAKLQVGQFKRPFDGFSLVSSSQLLSIERDVDIPGVPGLRAASLGEFASAFNLASYDIGAMFFGATGDDRIEYRIGVFNGEGSSAASDRDGGKQVVGRVTYNLSAGDLPLSVSGAVARTDFPFEGAGDQPGVQGSWESYNDFELFAELGDYTPGPHVQAGVIFGDNPRQAPAGGPSISPPPNPQPQGFASMVAWQAIGAWRFAVRGTEWLEAIEPSFRVTRAEPNTEIDDDEVTAVTPGLNIYFHGRNKLQLGWDHVSFAGDAFDSVSSFKSQFQVYF